MKRLVATALAAALTCSVAQAFVTTSHAKEVNVQTNNVQLGGFVTDGQGNALIGVSVKIKGRSEGVITDIDGKFAMSAPDGSILVVSYVGFKTREIHVTGTRTDMKITLEEDHQVLNEVVVTGFGLSQKKSTLTGAISSVGANELEKSISPNVSGALAGKIAGINFRQTDGRPGSTTSIRIRNMGTPLFVIDGVIKDEGQFNNIDFNDIESISVLKDASAAIYGVRAGNGVIVVTTKHGRLNSGNTVTLNTYYGTQTPITFPKPANTQTFITNLIQSQTIQGSAYSYTKEEYQKWMQGTEKGYQGFDWYDYIWKSAPQYYANVNFSGGSDKINYYASLGYLNQDATIHNYGGFKRYNAQMNIDAQITKKLKMGVSMNGRYEERVNPGVPGADDYWTAIFGTYRNLPTKRPFANDNPLYPQQTSSDNSTNFAILNYDTSGKMKDAWRVMQLNGNVEYEIVKGLKAKALVGYYFADRRMDNQEYTYKLYRYDKATNTYPVAFSMDNPYRQRIYESVEELTSNLQLAYNRVFGQHTVGAILGFESSKRNHPNTEIVGQPVANSMPLIHFTDINTFNDHGNNTEARLGYLVRLNYDFAGKYLIELAGRYDGSWKFPPHHRWGFFPYGSIGWRISEEKFWKESKMNNIVENLKVRASYGMTGDDDLGGLGYNAGDFLGGFNYNNGGGVIDGKYVIGTVPRGFPVTNLSWMRSKILDIGIDFSLFNSRLDGSFDFFRRKLSGIPAERNDVVLPSEVGVGLPKENLESRVNMGYDISLDWNDNIGKDVQYNVGFNMTLARVYSWDKYNPRFANAWDEYRNSAVHRYANITWGYHYVGQFQSWDEIASYPINNDGKGNTTLRPGDLKYEDVNGDKIINDMDKRPIGFYTGTDYNPVINFGFRLGASWKGISVNAEFAGSAMSSYLPNFENKLPFHDGGNNPQYMMEDTWRLSNIWDANSALIPGKYPMMLVGNSGHSNYWDSDFWIKKVRYLKLRNLEIGYQIPQQWTSKVHIKDIRVYVAAQNLFAISSIPVDPEITKDSGLTIPPTRVINIGLTAKF